MRSTATNKALSATSFAAIVTMGAVTIGCGTPAIDAMRVKSLSLPGNPSFCVRQPRMIPLSALMDDGARRTIDPHASRADRFDPGLLDWTATIGKVRLVRTGALSPSPDFAEYVPPERESELLEKDVKLSIAIKGNPFLKGEIELKADFSCPVTVDYSGPSGSPGSAGSAGSSGGPGGPGGNASPVEVFLAPFETDKHGTLIQVRVDSRNDSTAFLLAPNGHITVGARGGDGGAGGPGGNGTQGADKGTGCGDGSAGGPGGSGGAGGPGGQGGQVLVHVDEAHTDWAHLVDVENGPGQGGSSGPGGQGGPGGRPGTQPDGPNQGQTCGSQGSAGASGASGSAGPGGVAGPPAQVSVGHLSAGETMARKAAATAPPPDSPEAKGIEAFWAARKGPHLVHVNNGSTVPICSIYSGEAAAPAPTVAPTTKGKPGKAAPEAKAPPRVNLLLVPLNPGDGRDLAHVGGAGTLPFTVVSCDEKQRGAFAAHLDRDTTVSFQPAGKAPKQGQGLAVFLSASP